MKIERHTPERGRVFTFHFWPRIPPQTFTAGHRCNGHWTSIAMPKVKCEDMTPDSSNNDYDTAGIAFLKFNDTSCCGNGISIPTALKRSWIIEFNS